jgi:hypothetical protein
VPEKLNYPVNGYVYSLEGKLVKTFVLNSGSEINVRDLKGGQYLVVLESGEEHFCGKFIKQ